MKKIWLLLLSIGICSLSTKSVFGWPRIGYGASAVTQNSGDRATGLSVTVSSTSATQVYSSTAKHREILLQNTSETYVLHCGTFSAVTAASGINRFILPKFPTALSTNGTASIYCIGEAGATAVEVTGWSEFDSKD